MAGKPALFPEDYDAKRYDPKNRTSQDPSRIEGWSETVQANDLDKSNDLDFRNAHATATNVKSKVDVFRMLGASPAELPVDFAWLRVNGPGGAHSASAAAEIDAYTADKGFIMCTKPRFDALSAHYGYRFNEATWRVAEDNSIRRGYDVALFYRPGEVARVWDKQLTDDAARVEGKFPETLTSARESSGPAETFVEREVEEVMITH